MSRTMMTDAILNSPRGTMALQDCPDCQGRTFVHMLGEEYPCPCCQEAAFAEQCRERRIDAGQFGAGA